MKIYIDGNPVAFPNDSLLNPSFTLRRKTEDGETAFSFSGDLNFIGSDYTYIYTKLKTDPNALNNKINLKFEDDCCSPSNIYEFYIAADSIKWCENSCEITAAAIEKSATNEQYICLKNTLIWDDWNGFKNKQHPRFAYCNELRPNWMHDVIILLVILAMLVLLVLTPVLLVIGIIVTIINAIINAVNTLPGVSLNLIDFDNDPSTNVFQDMQNYGNQLLSWAIGCGRKHPSPLVRDYADNVCGKCGVSFQSSILKNNSSAYHNLCYVNAPVDKGTQATDTTTYWIDKNKPLLNGTMFFEQIKKVFNADWKIKNNILYFERRDFFVPSMPWLDLTTIDPGKIKVCWNWSKKTRYSYANLCYQKDAYNWVGSEAADRWSDIVEWNNPYTPTQKGELNPLIEFSPCRFRDDGIDRDVLSAYKNFPVIGPLIQNNDNVILLNSHLIFQPMLLIWDPNTGTDNAKVDPTAAYFPGYPGVGPNQFYNYAMWFDANYPNNLYDKFFAIEDPRTSGYLGLEFVAEIEMDCVNKAAINIDGVIKTSEGLSKELKEIIVNFKSKKITITGEV